MIFCTRKYIYVYWNELAPRNNFEYSCFSEYLWKYMKCEMKNSKFEKIKVINPFIEFFN